MKTVSLLEFRRDAEAILRKVQRGESLLLTRRGKPVARIEPVRSSNPPRDDPFYRLAELADPNVKPVLTNEEIDRIVYGI